MPQYGGNTNITLCRKKFISYLHIVTATRAVQTHLKGWMQFSQSEGMLRDQYRGRI
jgi:hypothetical protein